MGIYTDEKLVIEAYDKLINEDGRCTALKYPEEPEIYKIPLNKFLGEKVPWAETIDGKFCFYAKKLEKVEGEEWVKGGEGSA